ncbi:MAG: DUF721 domain-containing protein [Gammaproteobacteria bacterium]|nr:DUF721 domain-containing protein [Gammaproteobacteria bacterium]
MPRIHDSIKSPIRILKGKGAISRLYRHARALLDMQARIREVVPGDIYVAGFHDGVLHLVTPSAALATRLRYQQRRFTGTLEFEGKPVKSLRVSVRPDLEKPAPEPAQNREMSEASARRVAETAEYIEDDGLREALIRLSSHSKDR